MIRKAIEKIEEMAAAKIIEVGDRKYSTKNLVPVKEPVPDPIGVSTLASVVSYLKSGLDGFDQSALFIHVMSHAHVAIFSSLIQPFGQRYELMTATAMTPRIILNSPIDVESFIIQLQSMFCETDEREELLKFLGSITAGFTKTMKDNGVAQTITTKVGAMVDDVEVPSPVTLKPYRTFIEIDQPGSMFVFRIHAGHDQPTCALYEADGGAWKLDAIKMISDWIQAELPDISVIA